MYTYVYVQLLPHLFKPCVNLNVTLAKRYQIHQHVCGCSCSGYCRLVASYLANLDVRPNLRSKIPIEHGHVHAKIPQTKIL